MVLYKCDREDYRGKKTNKQTNQKKPNNSWWSELNLSPPPPHFKSSALTTWPRCLGLNAVKIYKVNRVYTASAGENQSEGPS